jgi:DNA repair protein RecN (Recombination protein N)
LIEEIVIRDLGVIGEARLQIGPGFTALTGETGAGKTMILTALGLLLGDRADSASVRRGQEQAQVHGLWKLDQNSKASAQVAERLGEADVDYEPSELIISRTVSADGKSRASINARPVPAGLLTELGEKLVVVHGQSEQMRLKSPAAQREALDAFAGADLAQALARYQENFALWKSDQERLLDLKAQASSRVQQAQELRIELAELDQADPKPAEDQELAAIAERLNNSEAIRSAAAAAHEALSSESVGDVQDVLGLLSQARKSLESGSQFDSRMDPLVAQLKELGIQAREAASQIASLLASLEVDGERSLDEVQARRSVLIGLMRRFGPSLDEVITYREKASLRLLDLDSSEDQVLSLIHI